jgi:hypothetical protein
MIAPAASASCTRSMFARERLAGAQPLLCLAPLRHVVEENRDLSVRGIAYAHRAHVEPALEGVGVAFEVGRLSGLGDMAIGIEPELLEVRREFGDPLAAKIDAGLAFEGWIGLDEAIVDRPVVGVVLDLNDGEGSLDRLDDGLKALLAARQRIDGDTLLRHVARDPRESDGHAVCVALDLSLARDPADLAVVGAPNAIFDVERRRTRSAGLKVGYEVSVFRKDQFLEHRGRQRGTIIHAVQTAEFGRRMEDAVHADMEHADAARLRPAQAQLCLFQLPAGEMLLGTIAQHLDVADVPARSVVERRQFAARPEAFASLTNVPALVGGAPAGHGTTHLLRRHRARPVFLGEDQRRVLADRLFFGPAQHPFGALAPFEDRAIEIGRDDREIGGTVDDRALPRLGRRRGMQGAALLELRHDLPREHPDCAFLHRGQRARLVIEHAERAERQAIVGLEQRAGVEADVRIARDERVAIEARILGGIGHHQEIVFQQRVGAERRRQRRAVDAETDFSLEELLVATDQVHHRDRRLADRRDEFGDLVERRLARRAHDPVAGQRF